MKQTRPTRPNHKGKAPSPPEPDPPVAATQVPFDIDEVIRRVREAVRPFPKAAMFELADEGYDSVFEQLVGCIISIRTRDEVTLPTARRLFAVTRTPDEVARLSPAEIADLIRACMYYQPKAERIHEIARRARDEFGGVLPCDADVLMSFHGVGVKCANLVLGVACGQQRICVDVHVHRVTNRWGLVKASTPEKTLKALETVLPRRYWVEINRLLVPFGKHVCTGALPKCSTCPVREMCRQVGVTRHR
jgi:endonuclease-3